MSAENLARFDLAEHCRLIATIPRIVTKQSTRLIRSYGIALRWAKAHGEFNEGWTQSAFRAGYFAGVRAAMRWPNEANQAPSTTNTGRTRKGKPSQSSDLSTTPCGAD